MGIFQAFILGSIQGLTEFLPISSSAHLVLAPWAFNWQDPGLGFDLALHWGTLLAVLAYYWQDLLLIIKGFWHSLFKSSRDLQNNIYQKLAWLLILASIPGALIGKLLEQQAESAFRHELIIAAMLGSFGIVMLVGDWLGKRVKNLDRITKLDALLIGVAQALAIIPGVSRSGATITAGLFLGFKRADAARFSFLMSVPIIFGAGLVKLKDFSSVAGGPELIVGFLSAAVFGFLSIKYLLRYLTNHDFKIFVWYRLALAALVLIIYFTRN